MLVGQGWLRMPSSAPGGPNHLIGSACVEWQAHDSQDIHGCKNWKGRHKHKWLSTRRFWKKKSMFDPVKKTDLFCLAWFGFTKPSPAGSSPPSQYMRIGALYASLRVVSSQVLGMAAGNLQAISWTWKQSRFSTINQVLGIICHRKPLMMRVCIWLLDMLMFEIPNVCSIKEAYHYNSLHLIPVWY